jgi:hypothetical protein
MSTLSLFFTFDVALIFSVSHGSPLYFVSLIGLQFAARVFRCAALLVAWPFLPVATIYTNTAAASWVRKSKEIFPGVCINNFRSLSEFTIESASIPI